MMQDPSAVLITTFVVTGVVGLALGLWYLWALARLFPRLGLPAWQGWVPFLNQWQLLERAGMPGWLILLGLVSLGIVPLVLLVVAAHRLNREAGAGGGLTVLAAALPPLWAMLLAQRFDTAGHNTSANLVSRVQGPGAVTGAAPVIPRMPDPGLDSAWAPPPRPVGGPPPPPAWGVAPPPTSPVPSAPAPSPPAPSAPAESLTAPPTHPAAQMAAPSGVPPANPFVPPQSAPPAQAPVAAPQPWEDDHTIVSAPADVDDHTVVVARTPVEQWVLEIDGREYLLGPDTIVGRSPAPVGKAAVVAIDDSSRVLSKSHARFRQGEHGWTVEDLGSTNGTTIVHPDGRHEELPAHAETTATEHLELGTLPARLRKR